MGSFPGLADVERQALRQMAFRSVAARLMFDPDPQRPILRLTAEPIAKPLTTSERLALAERQMEEAIARWVDATMAHQAERAQARPISAVLDGNVRF